MRPCIFISRPRSGSTVLRMMLGAHPRVYDLGEIFNEGNGQSFFHFSAARIAEDEAWAMPSRNRQMFLDFVEHSKAKIAKWKPATKILLMDVKYEHLHFVYQAWQDFENMPALLDMTESEGWKMIHLVRRDVLASVLSNFFAQHTNIYHVKAGDGDGGGRKAIHIDIGHAYAQCEASVRRADAINQRFARYPRFLRLGYETLFTPDGGRFADAPLQALQAFLEVEPAFDATPKLKKVSPGDPLDWVENRDEVLGVLAPRVAALIGR